VWVSPRRSLCSRRTTSTRLLSVSMEEEYAQAHPSLGKAPAQGGAGRGVPGVYQGRPPGGGTLGEYLWATPEEGEEEEGQGGERVTVTGTVTATGLRQGAKGSVVVSGREGGGEG